MVANPCSLVKCLLAFLLSLVWRIWNFFTRLNDNDWLAATSEQQRLAERLFNASAQCEPLSLPWTMEMVEVADDDAIEFVCTYNCAPDSGLMDIQIHRVGVLWSVGVTEFYTGCLNNWPGFLRECNDRLALLDWSEHSGSVVSARLSPSAAGVAYSPQTYPLVVFAFGSYNAHAGRFRCCLAAVVHLRLSAGQPPAQILRRFFLRWRPEEEQAEEQHPGAAGWRPHLLELRPYFEGDGGCVVCQTAPAAVLLLPCRHACLCASCAARLPSDLCPMCRRVVQSRMALCAQPAADFDDAPAES